MVVANRNMLAWQGTGGFSLDASVRIHGSDGAGRERLIRYCARPPFALDRLRIEPEPAGRSEDAGVRRVFYRPARPTPDGRTLLALSPLEFLDALSRLIPPPSGERHRSNLSCVATAAERDLAQHMQVRRALDAVGRSRDRRVRAPAGGRHHAAAIDRHRRHVGATPDDRGVRAWSNLATRMSTTVSVGDSNGDFVVSGLARPQRIREDFPRSTFFDGVRETGIQPVTAVIVGEHFAGRRVNVQIRVEIVGRQIDYDDVIGTRLELVHRVVRPVGRIDQGGVVERPVEHVILRRRRERRGGAQEGEQCDVYRALMSHHSLPLSPVAIAGSYRAGVLFILPPAHGARKRLDRSLTRRGSRHTLRPPWCPPAGDSARFRPVFDRNR